MPTEDPHEHAHDDILPEIVVDESAEQYVQQPEEEEEDEPPLPAPAEAEEHLQNEVVIEPELPPAPEQDNIFQTGKPVKKKRNVSEKQRAHLERIRTKALERKKEKAAERKAARATSQPAPAPAEHTAPAATTPAPAPHVEPVPSPYLTHEDVDAILSRYDERRAKKKEAKRKEAQAQELVRTHMQQDDVWAQCFQ
jgi:hypothetical protein